MPNIITTIERYLRQQQALAGDVRYAVTIPPRESGDTIGAASMSVQEKTQESTAQYSVQQSAPKREAEATAKSSQSAPILASEHTQPAKKTHTTAASDGDNDSIPALFAEYMTKAPRPNTASHLHSTTTSLAPRIERAAWEDATSLDVLNTSICACQNCKLGAMRTNFVFGVGNPMADILIIGEAPGADEDAQGEPFVGRAGQLLTKILEAINLKREDVYIANIIKCRPPGNRRPEADEVAECEPYLYKQIDLIQPKFILALGLTAVDTLLKKKHTMGAIRGKELEFRGIPMLATYHPAALLRNPEWKRATWEDIQNLRRLYDASLASSSFASSSSASSSSSSSPE